MSPLAQSLPATLLVSLISLVGVFVVRWSERVEERLLGFAAGVLLGTAFLDLFPEAVERSPGDTHVFACHHPVETPVAIGSATTPDGI